MSDDREIRKLYHRGGHDTERAGAEYIYPKIGRLQNEVLAFAARCGERGFTQQDLAETFPSKNWSSYRSRVVELCRRGLVEDSGRRKRHPGRPKDHIVWQVVSGDRLPPLAKKT
jgi:hypothetical protein